MDDTEPLQRSFDKNDEETPAQDEQLIRNDLVDGKWGIAIVIGAFLINFICIGILCSFAIIAVELKKEFSGSKGYVSWILSLMTALGALSGPIASFFVKKFGCRVVIFAGSTLASISFLVSSYAKNILTLILTLGVMLGFAIALLIFPIMISVTMCFEKYRSLATGIAVAAGGIGTFVMSPLDSFLITTYGWRQTFVIFSGMMFSCAFHGAFFRPLTSSSRNEGEQSNNNQSNKPSLLKDPIFILFISSDFLLCLGYYVPYFSLVDRAAEYGIPIESASYFISTIGIVNTFSRIVMGYISDRPFANRLFCLNISIIVAGVATAMSTLCFNFKTFLIFSFIFGLADGIYNTLGPVLLTDLIGVDRLQNAYGLLMLFDGVALLIGPPIFSFIHEKTQSTTIGFLVAGAFLTCGGLVFFLIPIVEYCEKKRQTQCENDRVDLLNDN